MRLIMSRVAGAIVTVAANPINNVILKETPEL